MGWLSRVTINCAMSMTMTMVRQCRWSLLGCKHTVLGKEIPALGPNDTFKYLGLTYDLKGTRVLELKVMLDNISRAPLKPWQRLAILKVVCQPCLAFCCVLGYMHRCHLKRMNKMVRERRSNMERMSESPEPLIKKLESHRSTIVSIRRAYDPILVHQTPVKTKEEATKAWKEA
ncbi:hypothetical protein Btru_073123 [Bulinus truncatus]|nr:hypothetical protein Btru_073123 [Bulinus truncatus]